MVTSTLLQIPSLHLQGYLSKVMEKMTNVSLQASPLLDFKITMPLPLLPPMVMLTQSGFTIDWHFSPFYLKVMQKFISNKNASTYAQRLKTLLTSTLAKKFYL